MVDDLRAALLASIIISEQQKLTPKERNKIANSPKPIRDFCTMLIDKYGYEAFRKMYVHDSETWESAFKMVHEELGKTV